MVLKDIQNIAAPIAPPPTDPMPVPAPVPVPVPVPTGTLTPTTDSLKLNFEMTKQVMTTCSLAITLLVLFLKPDASQPPSSLAKIAVLLLFVSLFAGMLSMGRLLANMEQGNHASLERGAQAISMIQHLAFLIAMGLLATLLILA